MKKHNVEPLQESLLPISETRLITLRPKGTKSDYNGSLDIMVNGHTIFGLQVASKVFKIICDVEHGKPFSLQETGRNSAKSDNGAEGKGMSKKQRTVCNELYRGSVFALIRKDANLLNGVLLHERRNDL
jgi:hypothetical protein